MKLERWLFLMPMLCLLLILVLTGALAEEIKDTSEGNVPVTIIDDTTGASPANGTVTLPDYIYYQNATYPYYVDRGDTVTLNVVPEEDYEIGDLRVTYKRMNLHPHAVLNRVLWRWYQSPSGFKPLRVF